jgi:iron complex outermembrane recepter protein
MQKNARRVQAVLVVLVMCVGGSVAYAADPPAKTYQIGPQSVSAALKAFAAQADMQLIFTEKDAGGAKSGGVTGTKSARQALQEILKGTGLEFEFTANNVVVVRKVSAAVLATKSSDPPDEDAEDRRKEGKSKSSDGFRVAQVDQTNAGPQAVEKEDKKPKGAELQEVIVTGSRIPVRSEVGPTEVKVYGREQLDESGQTTVADFLNTLPSVSIATTENGDAIPGGGTTVSLRGLPYGTTLVLLNGRRLETSATQQFSDIFDLNNIPMAAVDRIEILPNGSSAIYGSDAIAGVVNIILRKDFQGIEVTSKYGWASDIHDSTSGLAWGKDWDQGSVSIVGSYQTRSELRAEDRGLTASQDYRTYGGPNNNSMTCSPGNVYSADGVTPLTGLGGATYAAVPAGFNGTPSIAEFAATAGKLNECGQNTGVSLIPPTNRWGIFAEGSYKLTSSAEVFSEVLFSHVQEPQYTGYTGLFGLPGFQVFTVPATNPFNPFGTTVGVSERLSSLPRDGQFTTTDFHRVLVGVRGSVFDSWHWELSARDSRDSSDQENRQGNVDVGGIQNALNSSNPATALNPFVAGPPGSLSQLQSFFSDQFFSYTGRERAMDGIVRGSVLTLPAGPLQLAVGAESTWITLSSNALAQAATVTTFERRISSIFAESRIPILGSGSDWNAGDVLDLSIAGRNDHYSDFGSKSTPQVGLEWRPMHAILLRAAYADSFKAPALVELYGPHSSFQNTQIQDPLTNQVEFVTVQAGGNPNLRPQTGVSRSIGITYSGGGIPNLALSVNAWSVDLNNAVQQLASQLIVNNASAFPGRIVRGPSQNGQPGPITEVDDTWVNFGSIRVAGIDYQGTYSLDTRAGAFSPSIGATQTYKYSEALMPGTPAINAVSVAQDTGDWAPRWKGTVAMDWKRGHFAAYLGARYVGRYLDYDSTREIGNFWLCDTSVQYYFGAERASTNRTAKGAYAQFGAVNLFDRQPQFSNFFFDFVGYDSAQADIRGRFLYLQVGLKL